MVSVDVYVLTTVVVSLPLTVVVVVLGVHTHPLGGPVEQVGAGVLVLLLPYASGRGVFTSGVT